MHACRFALAAALVALCARDALPQEINWFAANTPTDNRPRFREDAHLFRLSLNRLALFGGLTGETPSSRLRLWGHESHDCAGDQGCTSAVDLWLLSIDDKSKAFTWASMSADTGLPGNLTGAGTRPRRWVRFVLLGAAICNMVLLCMRDARA